MLGGDAIGLAHHLLLAVAEDDFAEVRPRLAGRVRGRQHREQSVDLAQRLVRKLFRISDEHGPTSPALLITNSEKLAHETPREIDRPLAMLPTPDRAGKAGLDFGEKIPCDPARGRGGAGR